MKKLLLIASLAFALTTQAQDKWTEYATAQPSASTGMRSISIVDDNVAWISPSCGTTGCVAIRRYAKTVNGGTTWTSGSVDLGASSTNLEIANIHGVNANVAFAAVFPKATGALGGIWKTENGGTSWTRQASASYNDGASFTNVVYFWGENEGLAMGDPVNGYYEVYRTTNGGTNWTRVPSQPALVPIDPEDYGLTNQFTVKGDVIWAGTTFGRILKSTDRGVTWTVSQSPIPDFGGGINGEESGDLAFTDENNGLLQTSDYQLFSTADGGATWATVEFQGDLRNFGISEIPGLPNTYISVGEDTTIVDRGSSYSIDGGLNWVSINDNPDTEYVQGGVVAFLNNNTGFASGFSTSAAVGGIYKWNGESLLAAQAFAKDKAFTLSPNPTSGAVEIVGKNISNVTVFDVLGKQVLNANYSSLNNVNLNLSALNSGVYMVKVSASTGAVSTIKVVKQ